MLLGNTVIETATTGSYFSFSSWKLSIIAILIQN